MKSTTRWARAVALAALLAALAAPAALAQEDEAEPQGEPEIEGLGRIFVEVAGWFAQPVGADLTMAVRQDLNTGLQNAVESVPVGTEARLRYRAGYEFRNNIGTIVGTWYATETAGERAVLTPAVFQFGETNVYPLVPGVFDDGLADGYRGTYSLKTRDVRLSFYRDFQRTKRVDARWFAGYRRMSHTRTVETRYYALAANLPPFLDPISSPNPTLEPATDRGYASSELSVRGIEAGLEVDMPIWRDSVWIETGLSVSAMRGDVSTAYESRTYFYAYDDGSGGLVYVDPADGDAFEDPETMPLLRQQAVDVIVRSKKESTTSAGLEGFLGFRYRPWKTMEVFGGFRASFVSNASEDVVPTAVSLSDGGRRYSVTRVERSSRPLTLEGYYFGMSFAF